MVNFYVIKSFADNSCVGNGANDYEEAKATALECKKQAAKDLCCKILVVKVVAEATCETVYKIEGR